MDLEKQHTSTNHRGRGSSFRMRYPGRVKLGSSLTLANSSILMLIFVLSSAFAAVPIRLYENVHPTSAAIPNTIPTASSTYQSPLSYSAAIPGGTDGFIWSWSDAGLPTTEPNIKFFKATIKGANTFVKVAAAFTGVEKIRSSVYLATPKVVVAATDTGISLLWLDTYDPLTDAIATLSASAATALANSGTLVSNMAIYGSSTTYLIWTATTPETTPEPDHYRLFRVDTSSISFGGSLPTPEIAGSFTTAQSSNSPLVWVPAGDYLFVFRTLSTDPGLFIITASSFSSITYTDQVTMALGLKYVVVSQAYPPANDQFTFLGIDHSAVGPLYPGTGIHKLTLSFAIGSSTIATESTVVVANYVSSIIQIKNTKYVAGVVGVTQADSSVLYSLKVFDTENTMQQVTSVGSLVLTNYQPYSLTVHGDPSKFVHESPFTYISTVSGVSTVRTFFFLTDACDTNARTSDICASCNAGYSLSSDAAADNECIPIGFERALTSLATIPKSCKSQNCLICSSSTVSTCLSCQEGVAFKSEGTVEFGCYRAVSEIEDGFGYNQATNKTSACTTANNCKTCRPNYQTCESCVTTRDLVSTWSSALSTSEYKICLQCAAQTQLIKINSGEVTSCVASNTVTGYGLDTSVTGTNYPVIRVCKATSNCLTCFNNMNSCMTCQTTAPYLVTQSGVGTCYTEANIPDGFGVDKSSQSPATKPCAAGCKVCRADSTICTECLAQAYKYLTQSSTYDCYFTAVSIPDGRGPEALGSLNLKDCLASRFCKACTAVFDACSTCATGKYLYTEAAQQPACYGTNAMAIPDGVGPDIELASGNLVPCKTESSCLSCPTDNRYCKTCATDKYLLDTSELGRGVCVVEASIPAGYGADKNPAANTQKTARKCSPLRCKLCQADYTKCTECLEGTVGNPAISYLAPAADSVSCKIYPTDKSTFPAGVGFDKTNTLLFIVKACAPAAGSACTTCLENYQSCDSCAIADYRLLQGIVAFCFSVGSFPDGFGPNLAATPKALLTCVASQKCFQCVDNYQKCSTCASSGFTVLKYISNGSGGLIKDSCLATAATLSGWGSDPGEANALKPCQVANGCSLCPDDYKKCTTCPSNQYLLDEGNGSVKCVTLAQIPAGKGAEMDAAVGTQARALACDIASCAKCAANYKTSCTECTGVLYLSALGPDASLPRCVDGASIPAGYRGTTGRTTEACVTGNCATCTASAATCTACKSTYFLHAPDGLCYLQTASLPGYRFDTGTSATQQCTTGCKSCPSAANTCTECFTGQFINAGSCYTSALIPDGLGINNGNANDPQLISCSVNGCAKCAVNHAQCSKCSGSQLAHFDDTTWSCVSALPSGYGNDPSSSPPTKTIKCQKNNCDACATDYTRCTACKAGSTAYLEEGTGSCYTKAQFPSGFGLNTVDSKVLSCSTTGCDLCVDDHTVCTKCQNNNGFYMKGTNNCIKKDAFAVGEGVNPSTFMVEKCSDTNCSDCKDDIGICKKCIIENGYYLLKNACITKAQIVAGQGISASNGTVENCASGNCVDCLEDFGKCVKCTDPAAYTLSAGYCYDVNKPPVVDAQVIRMKLSSGSVTIPLGPDQSRVIDSITAYDLLAGKTYTGAQLGVSITSDSAGLSLKFTTPVQIQKGRLRIDRKPTASRRLSEQGRLLIDAAPIVIEDFVLIQASWLTSLAEALSVILSILRLPASIFLFWKYPWTAMAVDMMATQVTYLGLLDGDSLAYPRLIFEMVASIKILPFRFTNPFLSWSQSTTACTPIDSYAALGYYCSWLDNYGENFIALLSITLITFGLHFSLGYALQKMQPGTKAAKAVTAVQKSYGPIFAIAKLDANHLEVIIFAIANYARGATGSKGVLSVLFGTLFVLMIVMIGFLKAKVYCSSYNSEGAPSSQSAYQDRMNPETTSLQPSASGAQKPNEAKSLVVPREGSTILGKILESLSYISQNRDLPNNLGSVLYYVLQYSRSLILAILTINLTKTVWVLLMLAAILEVIYILYLSKCSNFQVRLERYSQLALHSLTVLYLFLKAISTSEKLSATVRYSGFSNLLAVVLLMIIMVPVILVFCAVIDIFYPFMRSKETSTESEPPTAGKTPQIAMPNLMDAQPDPQSLDQFGSRQTQKLGEESISPFVRDHQHKQHASVNMQFEAPTAHVQGVEAEPVVFGRDDGYLAPPEDLSVSMSGEQNTPQNP